jgi:hypothetical protein
VVFTDNFAISTPVVLTHWSAFRASVVDLACSR